MTKSELAIRVFAMLVVIILTAGTIRKRSKQANKPDDSPIATHYNNIVSSRALAFCSLTSCDSLFHGHGLPFFEEEVSLPLRLPRSESGVLEALLSISLFLRSKIDPRNPFRSLVFFRLEVSLSLSDFDRCILGVGLSTLVFSSSTILASCCTSKFVATVSGECVLVSSVPVADTSSWLSDSIALGNSAFPSGFPVVTSSPAPSLVTLAFRFTALFTAFISIPILPDRRGRGLRFSDELPVKFGARGAGGSSPLSRTEEFLVGLGVATRSRIF